MVNGLGEVGVVSEPASQCNCHGDAQCGVPTGSAASQQFWAAHLREEPKGGNSVARRREHCQLHQGIQGFLHATQT